VVVDLIDNKSHYKSENLDYIQSDICHSYLLFYSPDEAREPLEDMSAHESTPTPTLQMHQESSPSPIARKGTWWYVDAQLSFFPKSAIQAFYDYLQNFPNAF
jgi:hypothetical protein